MRLIYALHFQGTGDVLRMERTRIEFKVWVEMYGFPFVLKSFVVGREDGMAVSAAWSAF